ncbi:hypothetical protein Acsp06_20610 [Actinomycetospora sp. NBRC 106375]|uniref:hypothetical protein n=1 Tax=Actinomycetospora sp. NBRC 106375 TaxID=3032207 RepID=UPI0024A0C843|nr:hypothetical protein [Actinomycetospora sp. NBRC 106375]GLZ45876.1 hypothetical protein Acsp06_20610 [Actinomycetospora sp. NBRC 106375]
MPAGLTRARQQTDVGEGLAVGCLVSGVHAIDTVAELDPALVRALASWPWAARYPAVRRTPRLGDIFRRSSGRRSSRIAQWTVSGGGFVPQLCDDEWDLPAACVRLEEATAVPARRWCELAGTFLRALGDDPVRRGQPLDPVEEF